MIYYLIIVPGTHSYSTTELLRRKKATKYATGMFFFLKTNFQLHGFVSHLFFITGLDDIPVIASTSSTRDKTLVSEIIDPTTAIHKGKFVRQPQSVINSLPWNASKFYQQHSVQAKLNRNSIESTVDLDYPGMFNHAKTACENTIDIYLLSISCYFILL